MAEIAVAPQPARPIRTTYPFFLCPPASSGEQVGRRVELTTSFEMKMKTGADGVVSADPEFLAMRLEQYKKTFPR